MRNIVARILKHQSKRLLKKWKPQVVVVSGSVGKTSTTQAIATILSQQFRVRTTLHNYNTDIGVPCSIFGRSFPSRLYNIVAWKWIILKNEFTLLGKPQCDVLVLELGTDNPGELAQFAWLQPDIAVVTAVAPEHMEFFKTLEAVAQEELSVATYSEKVIVNKNMVATEYLRHADSEELFNYSRSDIAHVDLKKSDLQVTGEHSVDAVAAGLAVGKELGMSMSALQNGAKAVRPQKGRMNQLAGIKGATLIDDTYNASPEAVTAALDHLYTIQSPQRIALLGNMNELGSSSADAHTLIGAHCDPKKLDLVVTLGPDANNYTAAAAKKAGCSVAAALTPYEAAEIIKNQLKEGATVLLKGSQNKVYAEEAVKLLLQDPEDVQQLVRQSTFWMKIKAKNFTES